MLEEVSLNTLLEDVQAILATTPERWQRLVNTLPAALLTRPPAPGEWSALACLRHLLDVERLVFPVRVRAFLAGQDFVAFDPDEPGANESAESPEQMVAAFAQHRQENLALLRQLTEPELARVARHEELGQVTLAEMLNEWAAHDLMHTVQAERALMQPFVRACGPWRQYFADHDVDVAR